MKSVLYSWTIALPFWWRLLDNLRSRFTSRRPTPYEPLALLNCSSLRKSLNSDCQTDKRTDGRIGELAAAGDSHSISIPTRPATSYSMIYHSGKRAYTSKDARWNACTYDGFVAAPPTEDIGVLSYSFHHNNSRAYKYRRTVRLHGGRLRRHWKVPRFNFALPFAPTATLFFSSSVQPPPLPPPPSSLRHRSPLLVALLLLAFPRSWTAVKQSRSAPPPLTIRIKPFNCRIVFDGSFSPAKLLFKLVPGYTRIHRVTGYFRSFARSLSLVMFLLILTNLSSFPLQMSCLLLWQLTEKNRYRDGSKWSSRLYTLRYDINKTGMVRLIRFKT